MDNLEYRQMLLEKTRVQPISVRAFNEAHEELAEFDNASPKEQAKIIKSFEEKNKRRRYVEKVGDDFKYLGVIIPRSKTALWFQIFRELYKLAPGGGRITYSKLGDAIKKAIPEKKKLHSQEMVRLIQRNLTDRSNGFVFYAKVKKRETNGKPLIQMERGKAVLFNNSPF